MHIDDLCKQLAQNIEEKDAFFQQVEDIAFFKHFQKRNLLNFDDYAGGAVISYLVRLLENHNDDNLKTEIINVINENLEKDDNYDGYTFQQLIRLLVYFSNTEIEEKIKKYKKLFAMDNSIWLSIALLERSLADTQYLYMDCISNLVEYKIKESSLSEIKTAYSAHHSGIYFINKLLEKTPHKENLIKILKKDDVFDFLKQQYSDILKQCRDLNSLDVQYIENFEKKVPREISYNIQKLILEYLSIYLKETISEEKVKELLKSKINMFKKLGFYAICCHFDEYKYIFVDAFNNIQENNIRYYLYEVMTILENININDKGSELGKQIKDKLFSLDKRLKFRLLHSLKNHKLFADEFLLLKDEYKSEIEEPKITFRIQCRVQTQESLITKDELKNMSVSEQIQHVDEYEEPDLKKTFLSNEPIKTRYELLKVFKDIALQNVNNYLNSSELYKIKKTDFKLAVLDVLSMSLEKNKDIAIEKIIDLINQYNTTEDLTENYCFYCSKLIEHMFDKVPTTLIDKMFEMIENLIKISETSEDIEYSDDITIDRLKIPFGRYLGLWMNFLACHINLIENKKDFIEKYHNNRFFYYNLGYFYSDLKPLYEKYINDSLPNDYKINFLEGVINSNNNEVEDVKFLFDFYSNEIIEFFQKDNASITKQNLIYKLIYLLFVLDEKDLYLKLVENLDESDIEQIFHSTIYPTRNSKYDKSRIVDFWESAIKKKVKFPNLLLAMFNEYCNDSDILTYSDCLIDLLKLYKPTIDFSIELTDFMEKLSSSLKNIPKIETSARIKFYNLIMVLIHAIGTIKYVDLEMIKQLESIISKYNEKSNAIDNVKLLCDEIYKTVNLIKFSHHFYKYTME